jgi:hypothetical protein
MAAGSSFGGLQGFQLGSVGAYELRVAGEVVGPVAGAAAAALAPKGTLELFNEPLAACDRQVFDLGRP